MQAIWGRILLTVSIAIGMSDVALAQQEEGLGKKEFLISCASVTERRARETVP